jgi:hypothetical protein
MRSAGGPGIRGSAARRSQVREASKMLWIASSSISSNSASLCWAVSPYERARLKLAIRPSLRASFWLLRTRL